jgi:hypothetical protein
MKSPFSWFDLPSACLGALIMGGLVGFVNAGHGVQAALIAASKQGFYTFFVAGFIIQFSKWLAARPLSPPAAVSLGVLVPTALTVIMVYTLHSLKGTPEPLYSTIPVVVMSLVSFFYFSFRTVRGDYQH